MADTHVQFFELCKYLNIFEPFVQNIDEPEQGCF